IVIVIHPGMVAKCEASQPTVPDFSCGFQPHLSSGTRSSTLRVLAISWSNSGSIDCPMVMSSSNTESKFSVKTIGEQKAKCQELSFAAVSIQIVGISPAGSNQFLVK